MELLGLEVSLALSPCARSHLLFTAVLIPLSCRKPTPQRSPVLRFQFGNVQVLFSPKVCSVLMCQHPNANLASTLYLTVQGSISGYSSPNVYPDLIPCAFFLLLAVHLASCPPPTCATRCSKNAALGFKCVLLLVVTIYGTPPPAHVALSVENTSSHLSQGCFFFALLAFSGLRMAGL